MSVHTLKRIFAVAVLLLTPLTLVAAPPSARTGARAAFDESDAVIVMFGGLTEVDPGTGRSYEIGETYVWDGSRWIRRFPAVAPQGRHNHVMAYDTVRQQVLLFGGRDGVNELADTWAFKDDKWSQIETGTAPGKRDLAGFAFDRDRGVAVLYGGQRIAEDQKSFVDIYDTWEFDGTNWTQVVSDGPQLRRPNLVYDEARKQMLLIGSTGTNSDTKQYVYDAVAHAWNEVKSEKVLVCVNDASVTYHRALERVLLSGGACAKEGVGTVEELYAWDGTNWTLVETTTALARSVNRAIAYDSERDVMIVFGGAFAFTATPRASTNAFSFGNWSFPDDQSSPGPRSLAGMSTDTARGLIYMHGGITDGSDFFSDFWKFEGGLWQKVVVENTPTCATPLTAFDTNRAVLVLVCTDSGTFEFDGTAWKKFENLRPSPPGRRFGALVYDENLRKTVLFGGYDDGIQNYINKTFTWDGAAWTEVKKKRPQIRALHSMWYDPILKRTVIYGGVGRKNSDARVERFNDMWSFNGTDWVEIKPSKLPPTRYGAQTAVNLNTGRTLLFGGLKLETDADGRQKQVYANDTWEWDGTTWREIVTENAPAPRENGVMQWDPASNRFILFGGWSGYYHNDTWAFDPALANWFVFSE